MTGLRPQLLLDLPAGLAAVRLDAAGEPVSTTSAYGWPTIARYAVAAAGSVRFDGAG